jgi:hypothetical protein
MNHQFFNNKYTKWYFNIIDNSNKQNRPGIHEKHHIIPKSCGGSNEPDNISYLSPKEHFICHHLLVKMTSGDMKRKMSYALWSMTRSNKFQFRITTSNQYDMARKYFVNAMKTRTVSKETREKQSKTNKGRKQPWAKWPIMDINPRALIWFVTYPDGTEFYCFNLSQFCKDHSLSMGNLSHIGKTKGFTAKRLCKYHDIKNLPNLPSIP